VLLKNQAGWLPMTRGVKTAVLGPHVDSKRDLMSDYKGDEQCAGGSTDFSCFPSIGEAFIAANGAEDTLVEAGVDIDSNKTSGIAAAMQAAKDATQVLIFIGIGNGQEREGIDRHNTTLPGLQESFTLQVLDYCKTANKRVAVVLINGGALAIDSIVPAAPAIVEAFYPSVRGAEALTLALFGDANRWGKLPITIYKADYINQVEMHNFEMSKPPGRTYKYYTGTPLFPFGYGMSYSAFTVTCKHTAEASTSTMGVVDCSVSVGSGPAGEEVLMLFHAAGDEVRAAAKHPVPIRELIGFDRVHVEAGVSAYVSFTLTEHHLGLVDENGNRQLVAGDHTIQVSNGLDQGASFTIHVPESKVLDTVPPVPAPYSPPPPPTPQGTWLCAHSGSDKICMPVGGTLSKGNCESSCK